MNFLYARNFNQLHRSFAPVFKRFDPDARPLFVVCFKIKIMFRIPVALHQPETFRIVVFKGTYAQIFGIVQRPPQQFAVAVGNQQAVAVMNFGSVIVKPVFGVFAEQEH